MLKRSMRSGEVSSTRSERKVRDASRHVRMCTPLEGSFREGIVPRRTSVPRTRPFTSADVENEGGGAPSLQSVRYDGAQGISCRMYDTTDASVWSPPREQDAA